ncbi:MAG TPA: YigZ family protein [Firmicutes bacterium]|nr:YigZ family protein [Candidatus Fermentithermobacillaceae bacterium]
MEFLSPAKQASAEYIVKRSKFIGTVSPAFSEAEAESFVESIRAKYPDATHNVYAYSVGLGTPIERLSDDGEPKGTAGYPILDVIHKRSLRNVVCVVTRYFGGTLLGAGGLLRAYGKTANLALDEAGALKYIYHSLMRVRVAYDQFGRLQRELENQGCVIDNVDYGEAVQISAFVKEEAVPALTKRISDLTAGRAEISVSEGKPIPSAP